MGKQRTDKATDLNTIKKILRKKGWIVIKHYKGNLTGWVDEPMTEGTLWALQKHRKQEGELSRWPTPIKAGDFLRIYNERGGVIFNNFIMPDYKAGWKEYPNNPGHGQPFALNRWIHWTQERWKPDNWAKLFLREDFGKKPLQAELIQPIQHNRKNELKLLKIIFNPKNQTPE